MKTRAFSLLLSVFLSSNVFAQTSAGSSIVLRDNWFISSSSDQAEGLLMPMVRITDDGREIAVQTGWMEPAGRTGTRIIGVLNYTGRN
jgi:hypothetical protein